MTKMTYAVALEIAINAVADNTEVVEKLTALKTQIEKKSTVLRKPTATQRENSGIKVAILNGMEVGKSYTITELGKAIPELSELSNQRISALVRQLCESHEVVRNEIKRKAYFSLA